MPGWGMPDPHLWRIVAYLRNLPRVAAVAPPSQATDMKGATQAQYVGSTACKSCHEDIYTRWRKTRMANVVRSPKEHPDAIIPDMTQANPLVNFAVSDIAFVYGSKWKKR